MSDGGGKESVATASSSAAPAPASKKDKAEKMETADIPPNQTVYVHNLNEKVKIPELKRSLYHVFSQFGNVVEVIAKKTYKLRGQAWIIFEDLTGAAKAVKEMQGFSNFYGKEMKVSFSKTKSDVVSKSDGTFVARPKRKTTETKKKGKDKSDKDQPPNKKRKQGGEDKDGKDEQKKSRKDKKSAADGALPASHAMAHVLMGLNAEPTPPNRILFIENLPAEATQLMLAMLFQQYQGFTEVRMVAGKPGIAFVEFQDAYQAGMAMTALQSFKITPTHLMKISYARQ